MIMSSAILEVTADLLTEASINAKHSLTINVLRELHSQDGGCDSFSDMPRGLPERPCQHHVCWTALPKLVRLISTSKDASENAITII